MVWFHVMTTTPMATLCKFNEEQLDEFLRCWMRTAARSVSLRIHHQSSALAIFFDDDCDTVLKYKIVNKGDEKTDVATFIAHLIRCCALMDKKEAEFQASINDMFIEFTHLYTMPPLEVDEKTGTVAVFDAILTSMGGGGDVEKKSITVKDFGCGIGLWSFSFAKYAAGLERKVTIVPLEIDDRFPSTCMFVTPIIASSTGEESMAALRGSPPAQTIMFLLWPNYGRTPVQKRTGEIGLGRDTTSSDALKGFDGDFVLYSGMEKGGCTGDDCMFAIFSMEWHVLGRFKQYNNRSDPSNSDRSNFILYQRKSRAVVAPSSSSPICLLRHPHLLFPRHPLPNE